MSQLVQLKNRINAISTIKKITNAMRIISMSLHSKLNHQVEQIKEYDKELKTIFSIVSSYINEKNEYKEKLDKEKKLVIISGSDKGLCGGFNSGIIQAFNESFKEDLEIEIVTVGKKIKDLLKNGHTIIDNIENLTYQRITDITDSIIEIININNFNNVVIIYTESKSFFLQKSKIKEILPLKITTKSSNTEFSDYIWEENPEQLYESLKKEYLRFSIKKCLFESLFSEQASRFRSMDNANRSANNLLEEMKMQYSKLRQAKITSELTELSSHF